MEESSQLGIEFIEMPIDDAKDFTSFLSDLENVGRSG